jgi:hypothetical protein
MACVDAESGGYPARTFVTTFWPHELFRFMFSSRPKAYRVLFYAFSAIVNVAPKRIIHVHIVRASGLSMATGVSPADLEGKHRWTWSPDTRGTIDILWTCVLTTFLCCWSVLVLNVPTRNSTAWQILKAKLWMVGLCALAPEIVFQLALGQWLSARRTATLLAKYDDPDDKESCWSIRHSFYLDMGGVHLQCRDWKAFPINSRQLLYLAEHGHVKIPKIETSHIRDRNKVDGLLRIITLAQTLWFVADLFARLIQGLAITLFELSTMALVAVSACTTFCWYYKPADVTMPETLHTETSIDTILREAGDIAKEPYYYTPLDFASRREWAWSIVWAHGHNYLRQVGIAAPPKERPISRFQNTIMPVLDGWAYWVFSFVSVAYFAIFFSAWNFDFPTHTEQLMWRLAAILGQGSVIGAWCTVHFGFPNLPRSGIATCPLVTEIREKTKPRWHNAQRKWNVGSGIMAWTWNNSVRKDPAFDAPVVTILLTWFFGVFYCYARAYIVVADFLELRLLPASAFMGVEWSKFVPHI